VSLLLAVGAAAQVPSPAGPQLWPTRAFHGIEYVSLREFAARFGLKAEWTNGEQTMLLRDGSGERYAFETRKRDFHFDHLRIFLGDPTLPEHDALWVSKLDLIKIVAPLLRPADHAALIPAAAPKLIVLDAGHGGIDPGKENKLIGINEKTATLDVALRLKQILEARGWRVLLTRSEDKELSTSKVVDLQRRADLANQAHADLFLSIHFNSVERDVERVTGVETYAMTPQFMLSTADERKDPMTDTAFPGNRLDYANLLLGENLHRAMLAGLKASDRGFKHARYATLRSVECPGALVECAYLSNNVEARRVATPEYRERIAEALAAGLQDYAAAVVALHPLPPPPPVMLPAKPVTPSAPSPSP